MTTLNLKSFGAVPDGKTDNQKAIDYALKVCKAEGADLEIDPGVWAYSDVWHIDGVQLVVQTDSDGNPLTTLYSLNPARASLRLYSGARLRNIRLSGVIPPERLSAEAVHRIVATLISDFEITGMVIETSAAGSMYVESSSGGTIQNNRIIGTKVQGKDYNTLRADGIHITHKSSDIVITDNLVRRTGDDCIAVIGYVGSGSPTKVQILRNDVADGAWGRGISCNGGTDIDIADNCIRDIMNAAGIIVAREGGSLPTLPSSNVRINHNAVVNCGGGSTGHPQILVTSTAEPQTDITIARTVVSQTTRQLDGIAVRAPAERVLIDQCVVVGSVNVAPGVTVNPYIDGPVGVSA